MAKILKLLLIVFSLHIILAACGKFTGGNMDMKDVRLLIIRQSHLDNKDSNIQISERTQGAPYNIPGVRLFCSAWRFNFDPVPYDYWVLDGKKLHSGGMIIDVIKKYKVVPSSEEDAVDIAKYALYARGTVFGSEEQVKKHEVSFKDGVYEVKLIVPAAAGRMSPGNPEYIFYMRIGNGIYECGDGNSTPKKIGG
jgi:hypothetical protein